MQWLATDVLQDIPNSEVNQVGCFVMEKCELYFVGRYYHRDHCSS